MSGFKKAQKLAEDELIFGSYFETTDKHAFVSLETLNSRKKLMLGVSAFDLINFNITRIVNKGELTYFLESQNDYYSNDDIATSNNALTLDFIQIIDKDTTKLEFTDPQGGCRIDVLISHLHKTTTFDIMLSGGEAFRKALYHGSDVNDMIIWFIETMIKRHRVQMGA